MRFLSKHEVVKPCISKFERNGGIAVFFALIFVGLEIAIFFRKSNSALFDFFYTIFCICMLVAFFRFIVGAVTLVNRTIEEINVDGDKIDFRTFQSSMLFGALKREPRVYDNISRNLAEFVASNGKFGYDEHLTGTIYLLRFAGDEFVLPENFYEDFRTLKASLET